MKKWGLLLIIPQMARGAAFIHAAHDHIFFNANSTYYLVPGGITWGYPTEAPAQVPYRTAGTISKAWAYVILNSVSANSTLTLRVNGVDTAIVITLSASTAGAFEDAVHTVAISAGDKVCWKLVTGATGTNLELNAEMFLFSATTNSMLRMTASGANGSTGQINGYANFYESFANMMGIGGGFWANQTESGMSYKMQTAGTFKNMAVYVTDNARTVSIPFTFRRNGVDTFLSVAYPATTTGLREDTADSVTVVAGDTVTLSIGTGAGSDGNRIAASYISTEFITTNNQMEYPVTNPGKTLSAGSSFVTTFQGPLGFNDIGATYQMPSRISGTVSHLHFSALTNTQSGSTVITLRKNGVAGNNTVTIPAGTAGYFEDSTHSDTIAPTDLLDYSVISAAGTGSMSALMMGSVVTNTGVVARGPSDPLPVGFQKFPVDNVWNTRVDNMPVSSSSTLWMDGNNGHTYHQFHPAFGTTWDGSWNGFPYNIICGGVTPNAPVAWQTGSYSSESDALPVEGLPIPVDAILQGDPGVQDPAADRHLILIDTCTSRGYEMWQASRTFAGGVWNGGWQIMQLSTWSFTTNALRQDGWTSADAAGLPIWNGLVDWNEVQTGRINHALRFTLALTYGGYLWPARHNANSGWILNPPMGMRVRLKASFDMSSFSPTNQIILTALREYGMIMADNGTDWDLCGTPNSNWSDADLGVLKGIVPHDAFEVVDESAYRVSPNSGQALAPATSGAPKLIHGNFIFGGGGQIK